MRIDLSKPASRPPVNGKEVGRLIRALDFGPWPEGIVPVSEEFRKDTDEFFSDLVPATSHPYSDILRIPPLGALLDIRFNHLVLPIRNVLSKTTGALIIPPKFPQFYPEGTELIGNGLMLGTLVNASRLGICVDWPSGVVLHRSTKAPVIVAFEHRNLRPLVDIYRRLPLDVTIFGDRKDTEWQSEQLKISLDFGCKVVFPESHHQTFHDAYMEYVHGFIKET